MRIVPVIARFLPVVLLLAALVGFPAGQSAIGADARPSSKGAHSLPPPDLAALTISVLDIGQGDAILIQGPSKKAILIDAGPGSGSAFLMTQLTRADVTELNLMVATHPHEDHIGGMTRLLDTYPVKNFTDAGTVHTTVTYRTLMEKLKEKAIPARVARRGQRYKLDTDLFLEVLAPREPLFNGTDSDHNNNSVVMRLTYGAFSMMFTGDCESECEQRLVADKVLTPVTVLKVGHHGSHSSSTPAFLDELKPRLAIASLATGNDYGHPHAETMVNLAKRNIDFHRTDLEGQVRVVTDGKQMWVMHFSRAKIQAKESGPMVPDEFQGPISLETQTAQAPASTPVTQAAPEAEKPAQPAVAPKNAKFVASQKSKLFHSMDCGNGQKISEQNRVYYSSRDQAMADGKEPAKDCKP